jgi:hypothetical protein
VRALNQCEYREILFNSSVSPLQKLLYAYLRSCMDWQSCIVGDADKKMISYQSIREHLEYLPPAKSHAAAIDLSRDQVKRLLAGLVQGGYIVRLKGKRYGVELRFFLPLASKGVVRPQDERHMSAIDERHTDFVGGTSAKSQAGRGFRSSDDRGAHTHERHTKIADERHTSLVLLSLSHKYSYYDPDDDDMRWIRYQFGDDLERRQVDIAFETEKFNLRYQKQTGYDMTHQQADWRTWMIRALEYQRGDR